MWRSAENIKEKKNTDRRKTLKSEEKKNEECEESDLTTICIFGFKLKFPRKHNLKNCCLYHQILFTIFMRCRIFETNQ